MPGIALPISNIVNVAVSVAQSAAQAQSTSTLLVLTSSASLDPVARITSFATLAAVGAYFGTGGPEYAAAALWFAQTPQPPALTFGRWVQSASSGMLVCAPRTAALLSQLNTIGDAGFTVAVDGGALTHIGNIALTGLQTLNAIASAIQAACTGAGLGMTCTWNGTNFVFVSNTSGANSAVSWLTAPAGGVTDISALIGGTNLAGSGSYEVPGQAAETALQAVTTLDQRFGSQWYALVAPVVTDADHLAIAAYIQAATTKHFYGITTQEAGVLVASSTSDLAYELAQLAYTRTAIQYSSASPYAIVSALARILTTDYATNSSVITLMFKQEPGVVAEYLDQVQLSALLAKNCNVFLNYSGSVTIIQPGTTCAPNQYIDTVVGVDNLAIDVQIALFNALYQSLTKIPQTDAGMAQLVAAAEQVCLGYVADGLIAPGTWTQTRFGLLKQGQYLDKGYYIYAAPVASQLASDRAKRMAVPLQIAVKLAGAVQNVSATIFVNP